MWIPLEAECEGLINWVFQPSPTLQDEGPLELQSNMNIVLLIHASPDERSSISVYIVAKGHDSSLSSFSFPWEEWPLPLG